VRTAMRSLPSRYTSRRLFFASSRKLEMAGLRVGAGSQHWVRCSGRFRVGAHGIDRQGSESRHWGRPMLLGRRQSEGEVFLHAQ